MSPSRRSSLATFVQRLRLDILLGPARHRPEPPSPMAATPGAGAHPELRRRIGGFVLAIVLPAAIALTLLPLRRSLNNSAVALLLVAAVVLAALVGGRGPGLTAALVGTGAFALVHTEPYGRFTVASGEDVETLVMLLIVGVVIGELVVRASRQRVEAHRRLQSLELLNRILRANRQDDAEEAVRTVERELAAFIPALACRWAPNYHGSANPLLRRDGTFEAPRHSGAKLPDTFEVSVQHQGRELGRLVFTVGGGVTMSREERRLLIAVADELADELVSLATMRSTEPGATT